MAPAQASGQRLSIQITPPSQTVTEGQNAHLFLRRKGGSGRVLPVKITTSEGIALSVLPGAIYPGTPFEVQIKDDLLVNGKHTVTVIGRASTGAAASASVIALDNDIAPTPPPPPTQPVVSPNGLLGATTIADNFDTSIWLEPGEGPHTSPDAVGAFRFTCLPGHLNRDDPIVYPGQPGLSHIHQYFGNTDTNANSTYTSLRTTGGSTCTRSVGSSPQRTAYWMPAMLDGAGNVVKPDWINTYYKQLPASDPECANTLNPTVTGHCVPIPNGLRFILGYNMATGVGGPADLTSRDSEAMGFDCVSKASQGGTSYTGLKHTIAAIVATGQCPVGEWLRVFLAFPQCWDGQHLDTADHRSHNIMPPQSRCPGDHPNKIPEVAVSAFYTTDANFAAGRWSYSCDAMTGGKPAGSCLHMDYWEAWSKPIKDLWQVNCIDGHLSCSAGNVGDSREIKGMQQVGPFDIHVLVPLTAIH